MRGKSSIVIVIGIFLVVLMVGCATTGKPGQYAMRALQTREIQAPFKTTFKAATMVLVNHGYTIKHSDKEMGLVVGEVMRVDKVEDFVATLFSDSAGRILARHTYSLTFNLIRIGENRTEVRMNFAKDGAPADMRGATVKKETDLYWSEIQKEAMIEAGPVK